MIVCSLCLQRNRTTFNAISRANPTTKTKDVPKVLLQPVPLIEIFGICTVLNGRLLCCADGGLRKDFGLVTGLPQRIVRLISGCNSLYDKILRHALNFIVDCFNSDPNMVMSSSYQAIA
jgi:hypothetical protein